MAKIVLTLLVIILVAGLAAGICLAAVGCTLNDPDRDVKRLFPQSTGYKTEFVTIDERGGEKFKEEIEQRLGDKFEQIYETTDVPYAYYIILKGKEVIGRIHGVNQKGLYGGMQLILATDPNGKIVNFYYQKLSSPESSKFRASSFTDQFNGLTLEDFYNAGEPDSRVGAIKDPTEKNHEDFSATMRGLKKNLILLDKFMLNDKYEESYKGGEER
jgi:hypothetical protein